MRMANFTLPLQTSTKKYFTLPEQTQIREAIRQQVMTQTISEKSNKVNELTEICRTFWNDFYDEYLLPEFDIELPILEKLMNYGEALVGNYSFSLKTKQINDEKKKTEKKLQHSKRIEEREKKEMEQISPENLAKTIAEQSKMIQKLQQLIISPKNDKGVKAALTKPPQPKSKGKSSTKKSKSGAKNGKNSGISKKH